MVAPAKEYRRKKYKRKGLRGGMKADHNLEMINGLVQSTFTMYSLNKSGQFI